MKPKIDVAHTAKLANLSLSDNEMQTFETQLSDILALVEKLSEVNTDGIKETSQVTGLENIRREDATHPSLTQELALSNAKKSHNGQFVVKGLLEGND